MSATDIAVRAAAVIRLARRGKPWPATASQIDLGKAYARALRCYPDYKRAVEWAFASNVQPSDSSAVIDRWWPAGEDAPESILALAGPGGSGKTTASIKLLVREGGSIIAAKRAHEIPLGEDGDDRLSALARATLLVIENLGKESSIGPTIERIGRLIDDRYEAKRPTIITTNLHRDGLDRRGDRDASIEKTQIFSKRYAEDLLDRIDGDNGWVEISEPSKRGGEKAQLAAVTRGARLAELFDAVEGLRTGKSLSPRPLIELVELLQIPESVIEVETEKLRMAPVRALAGVEVGGVLGSILDRWRP